MLLSNGTVNYTYITALSLAASALLSSAVGFSSKMGMLGSGGRREDGSRAQKTAHGPWRQIDDSP